MRSRVLFEMDIEIKYEDDKGSLQELDEVFLPQPSNLLKRRPQFARLVDIDLTGLLAVCLSELLANLETLDACDKDASLAGKVGSTIKAEICSERHLIFVHEVTEWIVAEINRGTLPLNLQRVRSVGKSRDGRAEIRQSIEVTILASCGASVLALDLSIRSFAAVGANFVNSWLARGGDCSLSWDRGLDDTVGRI